MVNVTVLQQEKDNTISLDVPDDGTVGLMKSLIEIDLNVPYENQILYLNNEALNNDEINVIEAGVFEGSLILVLERNVLEKTGPNTSSTNSQTQPGISNFMTQSRNQSNNQGSASSSLNQASPFNYEMMRQYQQALSDPFNTNSQEFIERSIKNQRVLENFSLAQEYLPESFANVYMLYINVEVNKVKVQAFVDSGAQSTIMSYKCAEKCNLSRLIDERIQGVAKGVGTTRIMGKIHLADLKIGDSFYAASFTILEDDKVDFLLGLDILRRYQCSIDLKDNVLRIRDDAVPFLSEKDIEKPFSHDM